MLQYAKKNRLCGWPRQKLCPVELRKYLWLTRSCGWHTGIQKTMAYWPLLIYDGVILHRHTPKTLMFHYRTKICGWHLVICAISVADKNQRYWSLVRREKGLKQVISIIELKQFILGNGWTMKNTILWLIVSNCGWQGICISIYAYTFLLTSMYFAFTLKTYLL